MLKKIYLLREQWTNLFQFMVIIWLKPVTLTSLHLRVWTNNKEKHYSESRIPFLSYHTTSNFCQLCFVERVWFPSFRPICLDPQIKKHFVSNNHNRRIRIFVMQFTLVISFLEPREILDCLICCIFSLVTLREDLVNNG